MPPTTEDPTEQAIMDQLIRLLKDESCQDSSILQLRAAMEEMNENNIFEVSSKADAILGRISTPKKPITLSRLMRMSPAQETAMAALATKLENASLDPPKPTKAQSAAFGLGVPTGFTPALDNPYYNIEIDMSGAAQTIVDKFAVALAEVKTWTSRMDYRGPDFRMFVQKFKDSTNHPIRCLRRNMHHIWQFINNGRDGWKLIELPENFLRDVLPVVTQLANILQKIAIEPGCHLREIVEVTHKIGLRLKLFRITRQHIHEKTRLQYMARMEAEQAKQHAMDLEKMTGMMGTAKLEYGAAAGEGMKRIGDKTTGLGQGKARDVQNSGEELDEIL